MKRRNLVFGSGVAISTLLSGCMSQLRGITVQDSDGDGVIDSQDAAPNNPNITEQTSPSAQTPIRSSETDNSKDVTPTKREIDGTITADTSQISQNVPSFFESYGATTASIHISTDHIQSSNLPSESQVLFLVQNYPNGDIVGTSRSQSFETPSGETIDLEFEQPRFPKGEYFYMTAALVPSDVSTGDLEGSQINHIAETDRLYIQNGTLGKSPHPDSKEAAEMGTYTRKVGEGVYVVQTTGNAPINILVYKSAYIKATESDTQQISKVISEAYNGGLSSKVSEITYQEARNQGNSTMKEIINYAVESIQGLPYIRDDGNYDNYSKFPVETIVEGGGDCEDTTILLASILAGEEFEVDTALIWLPAENPTHIGLGIRGNDIFSGSYYQYNGTEYYYTETTGEGWDVGQIPEEFQSEQAQVQPLVFDT